MLSYREQVEYEESAAAAAAAAPSKGGAGAALPADAGAGSEARWDTGVAGLVASPLVVPAPPGGPPVAQRQTSSFAPRLPPSAMAADPFADLAIVGRGASSSSSSGGGGSSSSSSSSRVAAHAGMAPTVTSLSRASSGGASSARR